MRRRRIEGTMPASVETTLT